MTAPAGRAATSKASNAKTPNSEISFSSGSSAIATDVLKVFGLVQPYLAIGVGYLRTNVALLPTGLVGSLTDSDGGHSSTAPSEVDHWDNESAGGSDDDRGYGPSSSFRDVILPGRVAADSEETSMLGVEKQPATALRVASLQFVGLVLKAFPDAFFGKGSLVLQLPALELIGGGSATLADVIKRDPAPSVRAAALAICGNLCSMPALRMWPGLLEAAEEGGDLTSTLSGSRPISFTTVASTAAGDVRTAVGSLSHAVRHGEVRVRTAALKTLISVVETLPFAKFKPNLLESILSATLAVLEESTSPSQLGFKRLVEEADAEEEDRVSPTRRRAGAVISSSDRRAVLGGQAVDQEQQGGVTGVDVSFTLSGWYEWRKADEIASQSSLLPTLGVDVRIAPRESPAQDLRRIALLTTCMQLLHQIFSLTKLPSEGRLSTLLDSPATPGALTPIDRLVLVGTQFVSLTAPAADASTDGLQASSYVDGLRQLGKDGLSLLARIARVAPSVFGAPQRLATMHSLIDALCSPLTPVSGACAVHDEAEVFSRLLKFAAQLSSSSAAGSFSASVASSLSTRAISRGLALLESSAVQPDLRSQVHIILPNLLAAIGAAELYIDNTAALSQGDTLSVVSRSSALAILILSHRVSRLRSNSTDASNALSGAIDFSPSAPEWVNRWDKVHLLLPPVDAPTELFLEDIGANTAAVCAATCQAVVALCKCACGDMAVRACSAHVARASLSAPLLAMLRWETSLDLHCAALAALASSITLPSSPGAAVCPWSFPSDLATVTGWINMADCLPALLACLLAHHANPPGLGGSLGWWTKPKWSATVTRLVGRSISALGVPSREMGEAVIFLLDNALQHSDKKVQINTAAALLAVFAAMPALFSVPAPVGEAAPCAVTLAAPLISLGSGWLSRTFLASGPRVNVGALTALSSIPLPAIRASHIPSTDAQGKIQSSPSTPVACRAPNNTAAHPAFGPPNGSSSQSGCSSSRNPTTEGGSLLAAIREVVDEQQRSGPLSPPPPSSSPAPLPIASPVLAACCVSFESLLVPPELERGSLSQAWKGANVSLDLWCAVRTVASALQRPLRTGESLELDKLMRDGMRKVILHALHARLHEMDSHPASCREFAVSTIAENLQLMQSLMRAEHFPSPALAAEWTALLQESEEANETFLQGQHGQAAAPVTVKGRSSTLGGSGGKM